jgi:hypothetical protein
MPHKNQVECALQWLRLVHKKLPISQMVKIQTTEIKSRLTKTHQYAPNITKLNIYVANMIYLVFYGAYK